MISATINGYDMPPIELDFINTPTENATDVVTLSGEIYTDFVSQESSWVFNYESLTEAQYNLLRGVYDSQFTTYQYPLLTIPHFTIEDVPVRMYINEKDIWNHCGDVKNVQITFRETTQLPEVS